MVGPDEYKLKIDIDEKEFARKIKAAIKGIGVGGMGGEGGRGGARGVATSWQSVSKEAYKAKVSLDVTAHNAKAQNRAMASIASEQGRTLARIGGVYTQMGRALGGQRGAAVGRSLEMIAGLFGTSGTKGSKLPQLVKIAGFMAGAAGIAGLGKAIIDSSPLLKAMMDLLGTMTMLVLMPIGTFIGYLLKPFILLGLKWIIPWFRAGMTAAKIGGEVGDRIISFFTGEWEGGSKKGTETTGAGKPIKQVFEEWKKAWDDFWNDPNTIPDWLKGHAEVGGGGPLVDEDGYPIGPKIELIDDVKKMGKQWAIDLKDGIGISDTTGTKHIPAETEGQRILREYKEAIESGSVGKGKQTELREKLRRAEEGEKQTLEETTEAYKKQLTSIGLSSEAAKTLADDFAVTGYSLSAVKKVLEAMTAGIGGFGFASTGGGAGSLSGFAAEYEASKGAMGFYGSSGSYGSASSGQKLYSSAAQAAANSPAPKVTKAISKFASGGLITEPIFGLGESGRTYSLGESGPERVTPVGQSGGDNFNLNIHIGQMSNNIDMETLKAKIQQWILEANSRRGMI